MLPQLIVQFDSQFYDFQSVHRYEYNRGKKFKQYYPFFQFGFQHYARANLLCTKTHKICAILRRIYNRNFYSSSQLISVIRQNGHPGRTNVYILQYSRIKKATQKVLFLKLYAALHVWRVVGVASMSSLSPCTNSEYSTLCLLPIAFQSLCNVFIELNVVNVKMFLSSNILLKKAYSMR